MLAVNLLGVPDWVSQGPGPTLNGQVENIPGGQNPVSGAIHTVLAHPTNADILYIGAVNGGIWKTNNSTWPTDGIDNDADGVIDGVDNNGDGVIDQVDPNELPSWQPLTDDYPALSIGAMDMDPTDPTGQTIVAGIGRAASIAIQTAPNPPGGPLNGLLKTTDGGTTWTQLGTKPLAQGGLQGLNIWGVASRGNTILVAANNYYGGLPGGIFRSTNGGTTFIRVAGTFGNAYDLVGDSGDPNRFYYGGAFGVFRSDDTGSTWTNVSGPAGGLIGASTNNIELAVHNNARAGTNAVYVAVINNGQLASIFRSDDGVDGQDNDNDNRVDEPDETNFVAFATIPQTNEGGGTIGIQPRPKAGAQGAIHFSIVGDPTNANIVYVAGDRQPGSQGMPPNDTFFVGGMLVPNSIGATNFTGRLFRGDFTQPAATQWQPITHVGTRNNSAPHADSREMVFDANGDLVETNDGGIYRQTNARAGTITFASFTGPIVVSSNDHGLFTGDQVRVAGVTGNTAANGSLQSRALAETTSF
ncbi:MAG: hypothetical protein O3C40_01385 [Planctomycetota bacterium]|nr:hypothetical protein [Planctomycetota bacterium]